MVQATLSWYALFLAAAILAAAYLVGSLSPSYLVVRKAIGRDIRQMGDGNAGAENVSKVLGLKTAALVGAIDILKGLVVVLLARNLAPSILADDPLGFTASGDTFRHALMLLAGAGAVIGHSWSIYLRGPGGRGAATAVGALVGLAPLPSLLVTLPSLGLMFLNRSSTWGLASFFIGCVGMVAVLGYFGLFGYSWHWIAYTAALPALAGLIHLRSMKRPLAKAARMNGD